VTARDRFNRGQRPQSRGIISMRYADEFFEKDLKRPLKTTLKRASVETDVIRAIERPSFGKRKELGLRFDSDVVEHYRASGPGWQTRINDDLRRAAQLPRLDKCVRS
jgi:uncharacterized protein (DUF4415 family)